ncbi:ubiquitin carboxyl-terminal hydrolase 29-like [Perca fluviatilis]|uniref:ubiquitin carboxyl-terminal hydrolase 29-like n=1 Tax=Perca fluviatilis TaxID=8168 RepID=UPI0019639656|nr:ubiquitin carboxyl-terminal hydrolase 29-like [Perca fluviatilis]
MAEEGEKSEVNVVADEDLVVKKNSTSAIWNYFGFRRDDALQTQTAYFPGQHTAENIACGLSDALASWHLREDQLVCITTDNGANVVKATELNHWVRLQCFGHRLHLAIEKEDDTDLTKSIKVKILDYMNTKYDDPGTQELLDIASFMDPRFKVTYISSEKVENIKSRIIEADPVAWWKLHQVTYPKLTKLARKYLCIAATSSPSERLFSTSGNVRKHCLASAADNKKEKRNSLDPLMSSSSAKVNGTKTQDKRGRKDKVVQFSDGIEPLDDLMVAQLTDFSAILDALREQNLAGGHIDCFGLPNIGQSCYMNSSLQSLLILEDFMMDISRMEQVWRSVPEAQLMRRLMEIRDARTSTHSQTKAPILHSFREAVSLQTPGFRNIRQHDAHEFLTSVLEQMRSLAPLLQEAAASMGRRYACPVEDHMVFKMENTRTCKSCGARSTKQEEFTNLPLDLVSGVSVEELLQEYLKETELEFSCECGGKSSTYRSSFSTLPRVLILQLKRFRFSPSLELEKADDPVTLLRDLVVSSAQGGRCYSLISTISHFGCTERGHYICDGVHPDDSPDDPRDRWLSFNDSVVYETTGSLVCELQQQEAYILFYKRQM